MVMVMMMVMISVVVMVLGQSWRIGILCPLGSLFLSEPPLDSDFLSLLSLSHLTQIIWVFLNLHLRPFLETWVISEKKRLNAEFKYTLKVVKNEIFKLSGVNNTWFGVIKVAILQVAFLLPLPGMQYHHYDWVSLIVKISLHKLMYFNTFIVQKYSYSA